MKGQHELLILQVSYSSGNAERRLLACNGLARLLTWSRMLRMTNDSSLMGLCQVPNRLHSNQTLNQSILRKFGAIQQKTGHPSRLLYIGSVCSLTSNF